MAEPTATVKPSRWIPYAFALAAFALFSLAVLLGLRGWESSEARTKTFTAAYVWGAALPLVLAWWASAWGYGRLWRLRAAPGSSDVGLTAALGGATLLLLTWLAAWGIGLNTAVFGSLLVPGWATTLTTVIQRLRSPQAPPTPAPINPWPWLALAPGIGLLLAACTLPAGSIWRTEAFGYDVLSYHLNLPRQWLAAGAMVETEHDVYGYLPNLVEVTYGAFMSVRGVGPDVVYLVQCFHASWAVVVAVVVAGFVRRRSTWEPAGPLAGGVLLAVPWVVITGSMAYNEMVVLALGAAAAALVLDRDEKKPSWRLGVSVGLLAGAATLAKLTAGFMVALPMGLFLLGTRRVQAAFLAGGVGALVLLPYLVRNALWTGNPVFPFATGVFGLGHWTPDLAERWDAGHGLAEGAAFSLAALARQWLFNTGYGGLGGWPTPTETQNIARFPREYGFPLLWVSVAVSLALTLLRIRSFRESDFWRKAGLAAALLTLWLPIQLAFWYLITHQQSRFLVMTLVPAVMLLGLGWGALTDLSALGPSRWRATLRLAWSLALLVSLAGLSAHLLRTQTLPGHDPLTGASEPLPAWFLSDAFASREHPLHPGQHPVNQLGPGARVMVIADTSRLFYLEPELVYASAFDASPLGDVLDATHAEPDATARLLRASGITHLWIGWSELDRLHATYGHDGRVTADRLRALIDGWRATWDGGASVLVAVPGPASFPVFRVK